MQLELPRLREALAYGDDLDAAVAANEASRAAHVELPIGGAGARQRGRAQRSERQAARSAGTARN